MTTEPRKLEADAVAIFNAGLRAVDPQDCVQKQLSLVSDRLTVGETVYPLPPSQKCYVIGMGKASASMARAAEAVLGSRIDHGLVITKYGHGLDLEHCNVLEADHPVPDENGVAATQALLDLISTAGPGDLVLCLISGGGSALSPAPVGGITLADKQAATRHLLACGATIHEINTIRKHLSRIKGGQLCRHAGGATVVALILSDVIGDDLDIIASGITAPDPGTFADCRAILSRYDLWDDIPRPVRDYLAAGLSGDAPETPKADDPVFGRVANTIVGSISAALTAAEAHAHALGYTPLRLSSMIQGEAVQVAKVLCAVAREVRLSGHPLPAPACLLAGGETTVTLRGNGLGGRNMELALSAAMELAGTENILCLSAGTDGTDGPTDAAGAIADGTTAQRAASLGLKPADFLANNDSYRFFDGLGDLFITGPTRTNVMDLQILLIGSGPDDAS